MHVPSFTHSEVNSSRKSLRNCFLALFDSTLELLNTYLHV